MRKLSIDGAAQKIVLLSLYLFQATNVANCLRNPLKRKLVIDGVTIFL